MYLYVTLSFRCSITTCTLPHCISWHRHRMRDVTLEYLGILLLLYLRSVFVITLYRERAGYCYFVKENTILDTLDTNNVEMWLEHFKFRLRLKSRFG
jgi:hypothetical protein